MKLYFSFFYKTTHLNEEVNRTEPSTSVRIPCFHHRSFFKLEIVINVLQVKVDIGAVTMALAAFFETPPDQLE